MCSIYGFRKVSFEESRPFFFTRGRAPWTSRETSGPQGVRFHLFRAIIWRIYENSSLQLPLMSRARLMLVTRTLNQSVTAQAYDITAIADAGICAFFWWLLVSTSGRSLPKIEKCFKEERGEGKKGKIKVPDGLYWRQPSLLKVP